MYIVEKAYKKQVAEQEAARKRVVDTLQESAKPDALQKAATELGIPVEKTLPKSGIVLRLIPAGTFMMGSSTSEANRGDEEVQHTVKISKPFYIGKYEVTQGQWEKVRGDNPSKFTDVGENGPVEQVSWDDCQEFLRKLATREGLSEGSMRLPTEAEWEYACRAGTQTTFNYGNDLDSSMANFDDRHPYEDRNKGEYRKRTMPVGSFKTNAWGLYDMHGNVWEWCQDWHGSYDTDTVVDLRGADSGSRRVLRGGSWYVYVGDCRSASRSGNAPDGAYNDYGFRFVIDAPIDDEALISSGSFTMGDTFSEGNANELPVHTVMVSAFYMDKYEVTWQQWRDVYLWATNNGYVFDNSGSIKAPKHPVQTMNWYDCVKWCNARSRKEGLTPCYYTDAYQTGLYQTSNLNISNECVKWTANGYRLPTEAEWEKAARGGTAGHRFPWSDVDWIDFTRANYRRGTLHYSYDHASREEYHPTFATGRVPHTSPVGYFAPNGYGLYDMAGNVWEWCWDWYDESYYSRSPGSDPRGPASNPDTVRVLRGGDWDDSADDCRVVTRHYSYAPYYAADDAGFRCVRGL